MTNPIIIIIFYSLIVLMMYYFLFKKRHIYLLDDNGIMVKKLVVRKPNNYVLLIILFCIFFALINYYVTTNSGIDSLKYGSDRRNYYYEFLGNRDSSPGLTLLFSLFMSLSIDFDVFLAFTTFICTFLVLYSLGKFKNITVYAVLFLIFTDVVFETFVNLKQAYAISISALFFSCLLRKKVNFRALKCLILIGFAIFFHAASLILVPVFLIYYICKKNNNKLLVVLYLAIFFIVLLIVPIVNGVANVMDNFLPYYAEKLRDYFLYGSNSEKSMYAFIKGLPFYLLFVLGFVYRSYFKKKIRNYDYYLFLAFISSLFYFATLYSYWMYRTISYFYVPVSIFFGELARRMKEKKLFLTAFIGMEIIIVYRYVILVFVNYGKF